MDPDHKENSNSNDDKTRLSLPVMGTGKNWIVTKKVGNERWINLRE